MMEAKTTATEQSLNLADRSALLTNVLAKNYISIVEVDLQTGAAHILKSTLDLEYEGVQLPWSELVDRYAQRRAYPDDRIIVHSLTLSKLATLLAREQESLVVEVRCNTKDEEGYDWIEINVSVSSLVEKKLLVTTHNINEGRMLKSLVNLFVYQNLDYCLLLDAKHNSYTMFSGKKGDTTLPPVMCANYATELLKYNKLYVLPEDFERVTSNMQIPHVLKMLELNEKYAFQSNSVTNTGQYRRSQVQFQYYDKTAKLILLTRMDITQAFRDEQARDAKLAAALRNAQLDPLTEIYNQKATKELITSLLARQYRNDAALLFIDIDDFKLVNDTLGHQLGDKVLHFLAMALRNLAGRTGLAGRIGGDEFVVFLPMTSGTKDIEYYTKRICSMLSYFTSDAIAPLNLSCSVGIATYPQDGNNYDTLLDRADQALYAAKRNGKHQFCFYEKLPQP
ncbi:MAG: GGDEF domain-containing protein [Acidaminococcaceae bacterium]